jgi:hypothetical protein
LDDLDDSISLTDFSLDEFRQDLLNFLQAHKDELERAPLGLYGVVPPAANIPMAQPGVIYCLRQKTSADSATSERINPLSPHYLVYVHATGEVRLAFTQAKTVLNLFRQLALGKSEPYAELCRLFDRQTEQGGDMRTYTRLIGQAVESITATFQQRLATGLQHNRRFVLPTDGRTATTRLRLRAGHLARGSCTRSSRPLNIAAMPGKKRIFISSVQKEFATERRALRDYLQGDPLLRSFL